MRPVRAWMLALLFVTPGLASAQLVPPPVPHGLNWVNRHIEGRLIDYTNNHGEDRRIFSPILNQKRGMYVYLPPGYHSAMAYPLMFDFHVANWDETLYVTSDHLIELDRMIRAGMVPPVVVAMPDGSIKGRKGRNSPSSFFFNGVNGRFEDHIVQEVLPFLLSTYSIRPERQAHAMVGGSAGGCAALSLAIRYRNYFGVAAALSGAVNLLYDTCNDDTRADFSPATFRWEVTYHPDQIVGQFYCGLLTPRVKDFYEPVFGSDPQQVMAGVQAVNPATLIETSGLQPGELDIYLNYGALDEFNFDAHAESFAWLAAQRGIAVTLDRDPVGKHNRSYFQRNQLKLFAWIGQHILPPVPVAQPVAAVVP